MSNAASQAGVVGEGVVCVRCGYALAGLARDGVCPECGMRVEDSLRGDALRYADPAMVRLLRRGAAFASWMLVAGFVVGVAAPIAVAVAGAAMRAVGPGTGVIGDVLGVLYLLAMLAISIAWVLGWWWLTVPDPRLSEADEDHARRAKRERVLARSSPFLLIAATAALVIVNGGFELLAIAGIALALHGWYAMSHAATLARRLRDPRLVRRAREYRWLLGICATIGGALCGVGWMLYPIFYLHVLLRLGKDLNWVVRLLEDRAQRASDRADDSVGSAA